MNSLTVARQCELLDLSMRSTQELLRFSCLMSVGMVTFLAVSACVSARLMGLAWFLLSILAWTPAVM